MAASWLKAHGHLRTKEPVVSREKTFELATDVAETIGRTVRTVRELTDLSLSSRRTVFAMPGIEGIFSIAPLKVNGPYDPPPIYQPRPPKE